ncbi:11533_t:CDS:1, partial [Entrophospora sp. SA101]
LELELLVVPAISLDDDDAGVVVEVDLFGLDIEVESLELLSNTAGE